MKLSELIALRESKIDLLTAQYDADYLILRQELAALNRHGVRGKKAKRDTINERATELRLIHQSALRLIFDLYHNDIRNHPETIVQNEMRKAANATAVYHNPFSRQSILAANAI